MKDFIEFIKSNPVFLIPVTVILVLIVILVLLILALSAQVKLEKVSKKRNSADKQNSAETNVISKKKLDDSLNKDPIKSDFTLEPTQPQSELPIMQEETAPSGTLTDTTSEPAALDQEKVTEAPLETPANNPSLKLIEDAVNEEVRTDITFSCNESETNNI